jgi:hypothetical protein
MLSKQKKLVCTVEHIQSVTSIAPCFLLGKYCKSYSPQGSTVGTTHNPSPDCIMTMCGLPRCRSDSAPAREPVFSSGMVHVRRDIP